MPSDKCKVEYKQVQKTKVDLELAMQALDKLLKSNEVNFGLLAVLPSVVLTWLAIRKVTTWVGQRASGGARRARRDFERGLWRVERAVARPNLTNEQRLGCGLDPERFRL